MKQFLQLIIEQVLGGGGGGGRLFASVFLELLYFVSVFFQFTDAFFGSILQILAYFCCILCAFYQKVKQCFGHKLFVMYN